MSKYVVFLNVCLEIFEIFLESVFFCYIENN